VVHDWQKGRKFVNRDNFHMSTCLHDISNPVLALVNIREYQCAIMTFSVCIFMFRLFPYCVLIRITETNVLCFRFRAFYLPSQFGFFNVARSSRVFSLGRKDKRTPRKSSAKIVDVLDNIQTEILLINAGSFKTWAAILPGITAGVMRIQLRFHVLLSVVMQTCFFIGVMS
jgi:hypothetical protein